MKLIDVSTVQGRVNSILLLWEKIDFSASLNELDTPNFRQDLERICQACRELQAGLDFYAETNPQTIAPGVRLKRGPRRKKRKAQ